MRSPQIWSMSAPQGLIIKWNGISGLNGQVWSQPQWPDLTWLTDHYQSDWSDIQQLDIPNLIYCYLIGGTQDYRSLCFGLKAANHLVIKIEYLCKTVFPRKIVSTHLFIVAAYTKTLLFPKLYKYWEVIPYCVMINSILHYNVRYHPSPLPIGPPTVNYTLKEQLWCSLKIVNNCIHTD